MGRAHRPSAEAQQGRKVAIGSMLPQTPRFAGVPALQNRRDPGWLYR